MAPEALLGMRRGSLRKRLLSLRQPLAQNALALGLQVERVLFLLLLLLLSMCTAQGSARQGSAAPTHLFQPP